MTKKMIEEPTRSWRKGVSAVNSLSKHPIKKGRGDPVSISKYPVRRWLGQGATGKVFLSKHPGLGCDVAIKSMSMEFASIRPIAAQRFLQESKITNKLIHPNIIRIYDAGEDLDARCYYIVMEFVKGGDLYELLKKHGTMDVKTALPIIKDIARALGEIHKKNIVHRDVKPRNIMITEDMTAKIADLGLAKDIRQDNKMTHTGGSMGTVAYMAPEQIQDAKHVDGRADIYSLGVTLYHLLTGIPPYQGESSYSVMHKVVEGSFERPERINPSLDKKISDIICKMMALDRDKRYQSAREVITAIEAYEDRISTASHRAIPATVKAIKNKPPIPLYRVAIGAGLVITCATFYLYFTNEVDRLEGQNQGQLAGITQWMDAKKSGMLGVVHYGLSLENMKEYLDKTKYLDKAKELMEKGDEKAAFTHYRNIAMSIGKIEYHNKILHKQYFEQKEQLQEIKQNIEILFPQQVQNEKWEQVQQKKERADELYYEGRVRKAKSNIEGAKKTYYSIVNRFLNQSYSDMIKHFSPQVIVKGITVKEDDIIPDELLQEARICTKETQKAFLGGNYSEAQKQWEKATNTYQEIIETIQHEREVRHTRDNAERAQYQFKKDSHVINDTNLEFQYFWDEVLNLDKKAEYAFDQQNFLNAQKNWEGAIDEIPLVIKKLKNATSYTQKEYAEVKAKVQEIEKHVKDIFPDLTENKIWKQASIQTVKAGNRYSTGSIQKAVKIIEGVPAKYYAVVKVFLNQSPSKMVRYFDSSNVVKESDSFPKNLLEEANFYTKDTQKAFLDGDYFKTQRQWEKTASTYQNIIKIILNDQNAEKMRYSAKNAQSRYKEKLRSMDNATTFPFLLDEVLQLDKQAEQLIRQKLFNQAKERWDKAIRELDVLKQSIPSLDDYIGQGIVELFSKYKSKNPSRTTVRVVVDDFLCVTANGVGTAAFSSVIQRIIREQIKNNHEFHFISRAAIPAEKSQKEIVFPYNPLYEATISGNYVYEKNKDQIVLSIFFEELHDFSSAESTSSLVKIKHIIPIDALRSSFSPDIDINGIIFPSNIEGTNYNEMEVEGIVTEIPNRKIDVNIWLDGEKRNFSAGEKLSLWISTGKDCHLAVFCHYVDGNTIILFPNNYHKDTFVKGNTFTQIPPSQRDVNFELEVAPPFGGDILQVIACTDKKELEYFIKKRRPIPGNISGPYLMISKNDVKRGIKVVAKAAKKTDKNVRWGEKHFKIYTHPETKIKLIETSLRSTSTR